VNSNDYQNMAKIETGEYPQNTLEKICLFFIYEKYNSLSPMYEIVKLLLKLGNVP
jgi:hypothetical protein